MRHIALAFLVVVFVVSLGACASAPAAPAASAPTSAPAASAPTSAPAASAPTAAPAASGDLTVFAAASLTEAFKEIGANFEKAHPGTKVAFNFAGSQQLVQQLGQGARADVLATAAPKQMNDAIGAGSVTSGSDKVFARNRLVAIAPSDNRAGVTSLRDLAKPGLKVILAAKEVPVGQYARDFLDKAAADPAYGAQYKDGVLKNVVSNEQDVRAVLSKIVLGEGDAGIVYTTDITQDAAPKVTRFDIPDALNTIASYPIASVKGTKNQALADAFVSYVLSPDGQAVLAKYGFIGK
ncbi:MAG: molybdate ABC transporter substrate-binding protein [Anaerolineae bacterium]